MKNFVEELKWRGMLHDVMPGTEEYLLKNKTVAYIGFDPTAASLTIGNLVTIMMLVHFQQAGHIPMALVGGATGMIGDPSGRSEERNFLSEDTLRLNQEGIHKQLTKFLDFDCGDSSAKMVNNYDWFKGIGFLEFLRDAGKHLTVNYMMAKESVKKRLEVGLTFTEFSYQLLQGYDFYHLYVNENVRLQMGGSDQWGNITSGTELIRRMADGTAFALTTPLLAKADGTKFGKSAGGNIWLDPALTSPYKFYQFWLNTTDKDVSRFIRIFTLLPKEEIERLEAEHEKAPHERLLQKTLAKDITIRVHSQEEYEKALEDSNTLFEADLHSLNEDTLLSVFESASQLELSKSVLDDKLTTVDLLSTLTNGEIFSSKGEARRMIQGGGVSINEKKIISSEELVNYPLLLDRYLLVKKGKKNHYLIRFI